jgi:hypothetical protein
VIWWRNVASLAEVVAFQSAIGHLTTLTIADLVAFWRGLDTEDAASSAQAVREFLPDLLDTYASLSAELGAAFYDESRDAAGVRGSFVADPVVIPPGDRAQSMISWGIAPLFRGASVRDLVGTTARRKDGDLLGEIVDVVNFGAGDLLEVRDPRSGDTYLYPFTKAVVPEVKLAEGYIVIEVPIEAEPGEEEPD